MQRIATAVLAVASLASQARAQGRPSARVPEPKTWMSFSIGVMDMSSVHDGSTNADWQFGNAVQYRVSLEMPIQYQSTIGISGAFARVPLTYVALDGVGTPGCLGQCDADATVTQLMATFHAGRTTVGFHEIIDLSLGAIGYSGFRARNSGERLPPQQLDADFAAGIGFGFGYTFSPDVQVTLVQEGLFSVHQRTGVAGNEDTLGRQYVLRFGTRFGF